MFNFKKLIDMEDMTFDTIYSTISLKEIPNNDANFPDFKIFEMYDKNGGYYGQIATDNPNTLTANEIEEKIMENVNY